MDNCFGRPENIAMTRSEIAQLEESALTAMCEAWDGHDREAASAYWRRFVRLHYERTPETVAEMERRLGLK